MRKQIGKKLRDFPEFLVKNSLPSKECNVPSFVPLSSSQLYVESEGRDTCNIH